VSQQRDEVNDSPPCSSRTFCAKLVEIRYVQVHVFRARARYCGSFALVKKKIYLGMRVAIRDKISLPLYSRPLEPFEVVEFLYCV
jgi:hypothetical protein